MPLHGRESLEWLRLLRNLDQIGLSIGDTRLVLSLSRYLFLTPVK